MLNPLLQTLTLNDPKSRSMDFAPKTEPVEKFPNHPSSDTHLLLSFTNGALKRHHHHPAKSLYKECLKNHAAALGGHAIDGCGEFMPSPHSSAADPTSLKCAACGCHRNFHRKSDDTDEGEDEEEEEDDDAAARFTPKRRNSTSPSHPFASAYSPSAPQMLLALSAGHSGIPADADGNHHHHGGNRPATPNATPGAVRKRFRTKFTREQKEKMYDFAERLGWRMQRQDEGMVEEFCREIGVGKSVLKVWMHNHKNSFTKRNSTTPSNLPESNHHTNNDNPTINTTTNNGNAADNNAALNASSSSS